MLHSGWRDGDRDDVQLLSAYAGVLAGWVDLHEATLASAERYRVTRRSVTGSVKEAAYTVERTDGDFQVRQYAPQVVAETVVDGTLEEAGDKAFRPLFNYISGANRSKGKIAMTAPVAQQREGERIAMTAPVGQEAVSNQWAITFMMPTTFTLETVAGVDEGAGLGGCRRSGLGKI